MTRRTIVNSIALCIIMLIAALAASSPALAQCGGPGCPGIYIDTDPLLCCAPLTFFECLDSTRTRPQFAPYCGQTYLVEPCPCGPGNPLVAIWVGPNRIPVNGTAQLIINGCCLFYDVQSNYGGCIRVKITHTGC